MSTNTIQDILCILTCNLLFGGELMDDGLLACFWRRTMLDYYRGFQPTCDRQRTAGHQLKILQLCMSRNPKIKLSRALHFLTEQIDHTQLWPWHKRLGDLSYKNLHLMSHSNSVAGMSKLPLISTVCGSCQNGRKARKSSPKYSCITRAKRVLETIQSDLCGPIIPASNGKAQYFTTLTYYFSRIYGCSFSKAS